jgi:hypothetical protein
MEIPWIAPFSISAIRRSTSIAQASSISSSSSRCAFESPAFIAPIRSDNIQLACRSNLILSEASVCEQLVQALRDLGIARLDSAIDRGRGKDLVQGCDKCLAEGHRTPVWPATAAPAAAKPPVCARQRAKLAFNPLVTPSANQEEEARVSAVSPHEVGSTRRGHG